MANGGGRDTRQWMLWAFKLTGCVVCGVRYPELPLDQFHCNHIDPATKKPENTHNMLPGGGGLRDIGSQQILLNELAGCEVVCSRHHRQRERENAELEQQQPLFHGNGQAWQLNGDR